MTTTPMTPEQIADSLAFDYAGRGPIELDSAALATALADAIEADRAQRAEAIAVLGAAADHWARELREYIAPASDDTGDHESAASQLDEAEAVTAAIRELGI